MQILGIDIGGSGIKGAIVDTSSGSMLTNRVRMPTPQPSTPNQVAHVMAQIVRQFDWQGPIGCGFPAIVQHGVVRSAANIDPTWIGVDAADLFSRETGYPVKVFNDADAAGMAEIRFGVGKDMQGTVIVITIGTGLGTALFVDGKLVPNLELGHIEIRGKDAEKRASDAARQRKKLSWKSWAKSFDEYLKRLVELVNPDLIVLGGGASRKIDRFLPHLTVTTPVVQAQFLNEAGIIGAALLAEQHRGD
jgi:polyphosphate glucokinase